MSFAYGAITHYGAPFQNASARHRICNSVKGLVPLLACPTTPIQQRHQAIALNWFRLTSHFARRYSGSRCCFPFLGVLRCFNSPGSLYRPYVFRPESYPTWVWGFPIRTSTDLRLVGNSPWLFAATHVLLRLQAPRHPPLALCNLENYKDARARYGILKDLSKTPDMGNGASELTLVHDSCTALTNLLRRLPGHLCRRSHSRTTGLVISTRFVGELVGR